MQASCRTVNISGENLDLILKIYIFYIFNNIGTWSGWTNFGAEISRKSNEPICHQICEDKGYEVREMMCLATFYPHAGKLYNNGVPVPTKTKVIVPVRRELCWEIGDSLIPEESRPCFVKNKRPGPTDCSKFQTNSNTFLIIYENNRNNTRVVLLQEAGYIKLNKSSIN